MSGNHLLFNPSFKSITIIEYIQTGEKSVQYFVGVFRLPTSMFTVISVARFGNVAAGHALRFVSKRSLLINSFVGHFLVHDAVNLA